jgi:hypothetical protein
MIGNIWSRAGYWRSPHIEDARNKNCITAMGDNAEQRRVLEVNERKKKHNRCPCGIERYVGLQIWTTFRSILRSSPPGSTAPAVMSAVDVDHDVKVQEIG